MSYNKWQTINKGSAFIGDLKDQYGRRTLIILTGGIAVFARCLIEDYYVMKEDFDKLMSDFDFTLAAKIENSIPHYTKELEDSFDMETLEEIHSYLLKSMSITPD